MGHSELGGRRLQLLQEIVPNLVRVAVLASTRTDAFTRPYLHYLELGAAINFALSQLLLGSGIPWYLAGFAGMVVSSVWNFGITAVFTWRRAREKAIQAIHA